VLNYAVKAYGGVDVYSHIVLTAALAEGEWPASRLGLITLGKESPVPIV
jgi:hypothetical protein